MADLPISGLPPTPAPGANDEFGINQGLNSQKVTKQQILALPNFDVSMSITPFSIGTIGRTINATAVVTLTTFDSVESNQLAIEAGTRWPIDAELGAVTVAEGAGVTLEYWDGSSIVTGSKVLAIGVKAMLTKVSNAIYRIETNESGGGGGGAFVLQEAIDVGFGVSPLSYTSADVTIDADGQSIIFDMVIHSSNLAQGANSFDVSFAGTSIASFVTDASHNAGMVRIQGIVTRGDFFGPSISAHVQFSATTSGGTPLSNGTNVNTGLNAFSSAASLTGAVTLSLTHGGAHVVSGYIYKVG